MSSSSSDGSASGSVGVNAHSLKSRPSPGSAVGYRTSIAWLFVGFGLVALFSIAYGNVRTDGVRDLIVLMAVTLVVVLILFRVRGPVAAVAARGVAGLDRWSAATFVSLACLLGVALRIGWSIYVTPVQASDPAVYLSLARSLVASGTYGVDGQKAFWPPGYPLFLFPFVALFGNGRYLPLLINVLLFLATMPIAFSLARSAAGPRAARCAVLLLAVWPTLIMGAGIANKEYLVALCVAASAWVYLRADAQVRAAPRWVPPVVAGALLGGAVLVQPATVLIGLAFPLNDLLRRISFRDVAMKTAMVMVGGAIVIAPWTVRNYAVLHSFVPISTNGGVVFWSANNDQATGGWIDADYNRFTADELPGARAAWSEAFQWIRAHPQKFVSLTVKRYVRFFADDDSGPTSSLYLPTKQESRLLTISQGIANAFWFALVLLLVVAAFRHASVREAINSRLGLLLLMVLCLSAMHAFFQSEGKHHVNIVVMLAVLVASVVSDAGEPRKAATTG